VFIARNNSADIDVYDADTLNRRRVIPIPGLRSLYGFGYDVWGFTLCRHNACLYVGYQSNVVRRLAVRRERARSSQSAPPPSPRSVRAVHCMPGVALAALPVAMCPNSHLHARPDKTVLSRRGRDGVV